MRPRGRMPSVAFTGAFLALICVAAAQTGVTWTGTGGGLWSEADNWDPKIVPNNAPPDTYYNVTVNTSGPVVDGGFTIAGLSLNGTLALNQGSNLGFQSESGAVSVIGTGEINVNVAAPFSPTSIVLGSNVTLNGGGRITMGGAGTARIVGGPVSLTNSGWTISGAGHLLEGFTALSNFGIISASSGTLLVRAAGLDNANVMRAIPSGTLHIQGNAGSLVNTGGTILASGGLVQFSGNLQVTGGTLRSESGGSFEAIASGGGTHRLRDLNNESNFVLTGSTVEIQDTIFNTGTFTLNGGNMRVVGAATLSGGGVVRMNTGTSFAAAGTFGSLHLDHGTIRGAGLLGNNQVALTVGSLGKIEATGGTLFLDPTNTITDNAGLLVADSGTLVIVGSGSLFNGGGGRIRAESASRVYLGSNIGVFGGNIEAVGTGSVRIGTFDQAYLSGTTVDGNFVLESGATALCNGNILGSYHFIMQPSSTIEVDGSARFGTFGQLLPDGAIIKAAEPNFGDGPGAQLINDGLIEGNGSVGVDQLQITNNGTIIVNTNGQLTINPSPDGLVNNGVIEARNVGSIVLDGTGGGSFTQGGSGMIRALDAGSNVRLVNNSSLSGGSLAAGAGSIALIGTTTLADVTSQARLVQIGVSSLIINGTVVNMGSMTTGTTGRMIVNGSLTLGGGSFADGGAAGHLLSNGSLIVSTGGLVDAHLIEGTGTATVQSGGTLRAHAIRQNRLTIGDGASAELKSAPAGSADASRVGSLTIGAAPASLDLANRVLILDQSGAAQLSALRAHIVSGYNGGTWDGPGIRSSTAAGTPGQGVGYGEASAVFTTFPATYFGQTIDNTTLLLTFTRYGDANLDRVVGLDDFNRLAANFGLPNRTWTQADFNYDALCNLADFNLLAGNFGLGAAPSGPTPQDWAALSAVVPEPSGAALAALAGAILSRRRVRRRRAR